MSSSLQIVRAATPGWLLGLALLLATSCPAQDLPAPPTAVDLFERTLATEGLETALARLSEALADTTEPYAIDARELLRGLPTRLVVQHRRTAALELLKVQESFFGTSPHYWFELGKAELRCAHADEACAALTRAHDMFGDRPDIVWMLAHLDALVATARLQAEREEAFAPGQATGLQGPYLGQTPPGRVPEPFAPGILSTSAHEYHISFTPDGREIYFSRGGVGTLVCRWRDTGWTAPEVVHLIDADHLSEEANVCPDGRAIVFCGRRELRSPRELYRAERTPDGWGPPLKLFPGMYATADLEGTLYYTAESAPPDYGAIVRRRWTGAAYAEPEIVPGEGINSDAPDAHPFIAPDGNLLLFDSYRQPGAGIYASFRQADGGWGAAILLNDHLDIPPVGQCALSPAGEFLFFCLAGDMYWVDAGFLDELRLD